MNKLHVKSESDWVVCFVPTRQSATDRGTDRCRKRFTHSPNHTWMAACITISPLTLLWGNNKCDWKAICPWKRLHQRIVVTCTGNKFVFKLHEHCRSKIKLTACMPSLNTFYQYLIKSRFCSADQNIHVEVKDRQFVCGDTYLNFENPKSAIFALSLLQIRTFMDFRSRCRTVGLCWWR